MLVPASEDIFIRTLKCRPRDDQEVSLKPAGGETRVAFKGSAGSANRFDADNNLHSPIAN